MGMAAVIATTRGSLSARSDESVGEDLSICRHAGRLGCAGLRIVRPESVEFLLAVKRRLEPAPLLREHVQQDGPVLGLEKLERLDQQRQIVSVDGAVVLQAELLEHDRWPQHALRSFFGAAHNFDCSLAADLFDDAAR